MNWIFKKFFLIMILLLVGIYFLLFTACYLFYGFSFFNFNGFPFREFLNWTSAGLCFSFLASLCSWPLSLSLVTLLRRYQFHYLSRRVFVFIHFSASLPLVLFLYIFLEVLGPEFFSNFRDFWINNLASDNFLTKTLAFVITVFFYPISSLSFFSELRTTDIFFNKILTIIIEFLQISLPGLILVFILVIFIIPKMVITMHQCLMKNRDIRGLEVVQSVGGTWWESVSITMIQSMKDHFNMILTRFVRICFFESLIAFSVLKIFFSFDESQKGEWGSTLTSHFVFESLKSNGNNHDFLLVLAGALGFCYLFLMFIERYYSKPLLKEKVEIF